MENQGKLGKGRREWGGNKESRKGGEIGLVLAGY